MIECALVPQPCHLEKHYYKIRNKKDATYYISTDQTTNKAIYSNTVNNDIAWYFKEASTEGLLKYYYIINPEANDKYMYYTGNTNTSDKPSALSIKDINDPEAEANRFQFVIVQAAETNGDNPINGYYMIVPRLLVNNLWNSNSIGQKAETDNDLDIILGRENNSTSHWKFETIVYPMSCAINSITYSSSTGKITITATPADAVIHYTTDGVTVPSSSVGTEYTGPFDVSSTVTIKAIATKTGYGPSEIVTVSFSQVATPTIQNNGSNAISITSDTEGATIYYTTDGTTPTTASTPYTGPLTENVSGVTINAIAVKEGLINSTVGSGSVTLKCAKPVIIRSGDPGNYSVTISCAFPTTGVTIYYSINEEGDPAITGDVYSNNPIPVSIGDVVRAIAKASGYDDSDMATKTIREELTPDGEGNYHITNQTEFETFVDMANDTDGASHHYILEADVTAVAEIAEPFTGIFDGNYHTITGLTNPFFNTVNGGTVKNVILDNVSISSGENVGAICGEALGASRIYNCGVLATGSTVNTDENGYTFLTDCSSTISGSNYVGGLVGLLDGSSRVINCFSYANIMGGSYVGGIVGWNNVATNADNTDTDHYLKTMVMNCMFYGDITGGNSKAPVYNGSIITNKGESNGINNFNYFRFEASYVQEQHINFYNCALAAETRYLQRFEFFRPLLNSNRALAAWWATGDRDNKDEMMKWVMEPSQIGTSTPYPILKTPGKYPSVVNFDAEHAEAGKPRNQGGKLGTLSVSIRMGNGEVYEAPSGASITTSSLTLNILDKDTTHFNYNYYKVQLPYYNDVGTHNYNGYRMVAGWKIVNIVGGTPGSYSTGADVTYDANGNLTATPYNFADRHCTDKDLYSVSHRVFNQGAYWDVPEGVTAITIEPYWAKCAYLADAYMDVVYKAGTSASKAMTEAVNVPNVGGGQIYTNGDSYSIAGEDQVVFTSMGNAITSSGTGNALFQDVQNAGNHTVYDYAVVLVGNYHHYYYTTDDHGLEASDSKPYTVTSIDLDGDNEPDYSYIIRFDSRQSVHPVRVDFINIPGLGMAQKTTGCTGTYNFGILQPKYWFETTNTSLFRETQFEYDQRDRVAAPLILQGGVMEQWVSGQSAGAGNKTTYFLVGGNVWFKEFHRGCHQDVTLQSKHPPVSVTGGEFDKFYLTGLYTGKVTSYNDKAECYINGGSFGIMAGAGMEGIGNPTNHANGDITWIIDNADIGEFYAGGINAAKPVEGNLHTIISNSHVDFFYGGPKFGDLNPERTVVTKATDCTFGTFFGAGYGGNSYSRYPPYNYNNVINLETWNEWVNGEMHAMNGNTDPDPDYEGFQHHYSTTYGGVDTQIDYQFIPLSNNYQNVARLWIEYVKFSLATTHGITSHLKGCTVEKNFYGGGSLGKVDGAVKSVLEDCFVKGNVFGAGFSATLPKIPVMNKGGFNEEPLYDPQAGVFLPAVLPDIVEYTWEHHDVVDATSNAIDEGRHVLFTEEIITKENLGSVSGNVTLTLKGNTIVGDGTEGTGNVFGGGAESVVNGNTTVKLQGKAHVLGNVYGGGNEGEVGGNSSVIFEPEPYIAPSSTTDDTSDPQD